MQKNKPRNMSLRLMLEFVILFSIPFVKGKTRRKGKTILQTDVLNRKPIHTNIKTSSLYLSQNTHLQ